MYASIKYLDSKEKQSTFWHQESKHHYINPYGKILKRRTKFFVLSHATAPFPIKVFMKKSIQSKASIESNKFLLQEFVSNSNIK